MSEEVDRDQRSRRERQKEHSALGIDDCNCEGLSKAKIGCKARSSAGVSALRFVSEMAEAKIGKIVPGCSTFAETLHPPVFLCFFVKDLVSDSVYLLVIPSLI